MAIYKCKKCGKEFESDSAENAASCPFCGAEQSKKSKLKSGGKKIGKIFKIVITAVAILIIIGVFLTSVIIPKINQISGESSNSSDTAQDAGKAIANLKKRGVYDVLKSACVGDVCVFGRFEQDNNKSNGAEDIEWRVIDKKENKILLISKYVLDCQRFYQSYSNTTWEKSYIRKWMNDEFYHTAFDSNEQYIIKKSTVTAEANPDHKSDAGSDTIDRIFLLSVAEAEKYFKSDELRRCAPTKAAISHGVWTSFGEKTTEGEDTCFWWLRTPGRSGNFACGVNRSGSISIPGFSVGNDGYGVRPAMWISFEE